MSEPVLERSVLERKERDELQTIAKALGAKPPARAKKADLVDLILATAGITPPASAEPSRNGGSGRGRAATVVPDEPIAEPEEVESPPVGDDRGAPDEDDNGNRGDADDAGEPTDREEGRERPEGQR